ncbi:hypothetical protein BH09BAC2_BH09BAC2_05310 [soil metagenome]
MAIPYHMEALQLDYKRISLFAVGGDANSSGKTIISDS